VEKNKKFNIHDVYPENYSFDYEAFYSDPEHYSFTENDIAYWNAKELEQYEREVPMTPYEKRALRKWVISGHSPHENPGSKYICLMGAMPPYDFIDAYRLDHELEREMKGMNKSEKEAYLKEFTGWNDDSLETDDAPIAISFEA